jgi:hypothetical protein
MGFHGICLIIVKQSYWKNWCNMVQSSLGVQNDEGIASLEIFGGYRGNP